MSLFLILFSTAILITITVISVAIVNFLFSLMVEVVKPKSSGIVFLFSNLAGFLFCGLYVLVCYAFIDFASTVRANENSPFLSFILFLTSFAVFVSVVRTSFKKMMLDEMINGSSDYGIKTSKIGDNVAVIVFLYALAAYFITSLRWEYLYSIAKFFTDYLPY